MISTVQIVQHLRPGGIETMALDLARFSRHSDTVIISLEDDLASALAHWPKLEAVKDRLLFVDKSPGIQPGLVFKLARMLKRLRPQRVHTHHIGPLLYGGLAARLARVPLLIHTEHDAWHLANKKQRQLQAALLAHLKPLLVADSDSVAQTLSQYFPHSPIATIRNGIDSEQFKPGNLYQARRVLGLPLNTLMVGCSGRLEAVKGQHLLIDALPQLDEKVHLAFAGGGSLIQELQQQAKDLAVQQRVHFLGHLDSMPTFYQAIDVFCLPSYQEGFPLSPLEAQACGVPSIVTDAGGAKETLCPHSGASISPGDTGALTAALTHMLKRPPKISPRLFVTACADVRSMVKAYEALSEGGARL